MSQKLDLSLISRGRLQPEPKPAKSERTRTAILDAALTFL